MESAAGASDQDPAFTQLRRALIPKMPDKLVECIVSGGKVWDHQAFLEDFDVLAWLPPFVSVRRRASAVEGMLMFTFTGPRFYFAWTPWYQHPAKSA